MIGPVEIAVLGLAGAMVSGAIASRSGILGDRDQAISTLNALGIRVAFPALVLASVVRAPALGDAWVTWLVGPVAVLLSLSALALARRLSSRAVAVAGPTALVVAFGNVAYLGMPLAAGLFGAQDQSTSALAATAHVAIAVTAGPLLFTRWSRGAGAPSWRRVLLQPLLLSVVLGLSLRVAPEGARAVVLAIATPMGSIAAPVGAFVLGAYLERHRAALGRPDRVVLSATVARLVLVPAVALGLVHLLHAQSLMTATDARLALLFAAMPAAISTFSIAHDEGHGSREVAGAIVVSTVLSVLSVPLWLALAP